MSATGIPEVPAPGAAKEPLLTVGALVTLATALLGLGTKFGLNISDGQKDAILAFLVVAAPIVVALIGRLKVWSPASVRAVVQQARAEERGRHAAPDTSQGVITDAAVDSSIRRAAAQQRFGEHR